MTQPFEEEVRRRYPDHKHTGDESVGGYVSPNYGTDIRTHCAGCEVLVTSTFYPFRNKVKRQPSGKLLPDFVCFSQHYQPETDQTSWAAKARGRDPKAVLPAGPLAQQRLSTNLADITPTVPVPKLAPPSSEEPAVDPFDYTTPPHRFQYVHFIWISTGGWLHSVAPHLPEKPEPRQM